MRRRAFGSGEMTPTGGCQMAQRRKHAERLRYRHQQNFQPQTDNSALRPAPWPAANHLARETLEDELEATAWLVVWTS